MIKVGVFFGGKSTEHDVSIVSAVQAMNYFDREKYIVFPVYISHDNEFYYSDSLKSIENVKTYKEDNSVRRVVFMKDDGQVVMANFQQPSGREEIITDLDIAFPIVHGTNVEDGILQGFLKTLDIPFVGCDVLSSAVGMDKYVMKVLLKSEGYPVLEGKRYSVYSRKSVSDIINDIEKNFEYPVIVKPVNLGSSIGISKAYNKEELIISIKNAFTYSKNILVEKAIQALKEVNCSVLGSAYECIVSECEEPLTDHEVLDFEEKYISGSKNSEKKGMESVHRVIPANISKEMKTEIQHISSSVFRFLECNGVVRIDYIIDQDTQKLWLNEINTIPGSLAFYLWEKSGITYIELIDKLIELAFERYNESKGIVYEFKSGILDSTHFGTKGAKRTNGVEVVF